MIYLSGCLPSNPETRKQLNDHGIGILLTPHSQRNLTGEGWIWAADNGCFASRWNHKIWLEFLETRPNPQTALFAVVPDTVGDPKDTTHKWHQHHQTVRNLGYKPAYVLQDGATPHDLPWDDMDALFIGGSTKYKLSEDAKNYVDQGKQRNKWVHMGRVNSRKRIQLAYNWGCDSVDGTYLAFGPDINTPKLIKMLEHGTRPQLS